MTDAKNNAKLTGDTHPPEVEADDFDEQGAHPEGTGTEGTQRSNRAALGTGRGGHHAGVLRDRDRDTPTADREGATRESGEH